MSTHASKFLLLVIFLFATAISAQEPVLIIKAGTPQHTPKNCTTATGAKVNFEIELYQNVNGKKEKPKNIQSVQMEVTSKSATFNLLPSDEFNWSPNKLSRVLESFESPNFELTFPLVCKKVGKATVKLKTDVTYNDGNQTKVKTAFKEISIEFSKPVYRTFTEKVHIENNLSKKTIDEFKKDYAKLMRIEVASYKIKSFMKERITNTLTSVVSDEIENAGNVMQGIKSFSQKHEQLAHFVTVSDDAWEISKEQVDTHVDSILEKSVEKAQKAMEKATNLEQFTASRKAFHKFLEETKVALDVQAQYRYAEGKFEYGDWINPQLILRNYPTHESKASAKVDCKVNLTPALFEALDGDFVFHDKRSVEYEYMTSPKVPEQNKHHFIFQVNKRPKTKAMCEFIWNIEFKKREKDEPKDDDENKFHFALTRTGERTIWENIPPIAMTAKEETKKSEDDKK